MKPYNLDGKIAVVVGTITDDLRIYEIPKMTVGFTLFWELLHMLIYCSLNPFCQVNGIPID